LTFRDASPDDVAAVTELLGRPAAGRFAIVVRRGDGAPVVIENEPHLRDGTPMPTLYWLVDRELHTAVSRLESDGGVHRYEGLVDGAELAAAHERHAQRRAAATTRRDAPDAAGGVGGTRVGVKCLHAHLANYLATGDDPVGELVATSVGLPELVRVDVRAPVAALDCGSNSTRLLIVDGAGATLARDTRITRLAQGVDARGVLADEAMGRSFTVLEEYRGVMDAAGVSRGLLVATSAVRDAANGAQFLAEAGRRAGVPARILTGDEEAGFTFAGATRDLATDDRPTVLVDVGGGSTELATRVDGVTYSYSMQLGCVRVTERALGREALTPARAAAAREMIERELDVAFTQRPAFGALGPVRLVGVAGTVATLAQLDAGESTYRRETVHHRVITRATVVEWRDRLGAETPEQRLEHPGMVVGREDVLVGGLFVLDAVMGRLAADELITSESDILDGVAASI